MSAGTYLGNHSIAIKQLHDAWARIAQLEAALRVLAEHCQHRNDIAGAQIADDALDASETPCANCGNYPSLHPVANCPVWRSTVETSVKPTLICPKCGADRYTENCKLLGVPTECPMRGEPQSQADRKAP